MSDIKVLGIDLAKNVFQLHGNDEMGRAVFTKRLSRKALVDFVAKVRPCVIGMEACGGSHHWGRLFRQMGHEVRLVAPQYVKAFVRGNKTDSRDAQAIAECVARPSMRLVAVKTTRQQEIASMHRIRERLVRNRTSLGNEMRGILNEFGHTIPTGLKKLEEMLLVLAGDADNGLSQDMRQMLIEARTELRELTQKISLYETRLGQVCREMEVCQRLIKIEGVGPMTATAIVSHVGDAKIFKNGREMSAYFGLVPGQHSSGGKTVMGRITKRGDRTIRKLLIHGARSVVRFSENRTDPLRNWVNRIDKNRGRNKACVALANKNARIIWALMARGEHYRARAVENHLSLRGALAHVAIPRVYP